MTTVSLISSRPRRRAYIHVGRRAVAKACLDRNASDTRTWLPSYVGGRCIGAQDGRISGVG